MRVQFTIPDGIEFKDLQLGRDEAGDVYVDTDTVRRVCEASGIDPARLTDGPEDNLGALIAAWYAQHLRDGGPPDPVAETISAEVRAEDGYDGLQ